MKVWLNRCFRWMIDMLSGPVAGEFLSVFMLFNVSIGVIKDVTL